jgi:hypothetical protein
MTPAHRLSLNVVARLNDATRAVLGRAGIHQRPLEPGVTGTAGTPAAFTGFGRDPVATPQPLVKRIHVTPSEFIPPCP